MRKLLFILFVFACENTITDTPDNPDSVDYGVVINEINYNSSSGLDTGDWIELYNPTSETIELSSWKFEDENNFFTFPENTLLLAGEYLVLCDDLEMFSNAISPDVVSNSLGDLGFGLKGNGELIRLFDADGLLVDEVEYDNNAPWPVDADGGGETLELIDSSSDNTLGESWAASTSIGGTPGEINSAVDE